MKCTKVKKTDLIVYPIFFVVVVAHSLVFGQNQSTSESRYRELDSIIKVIPRKIIQNADEVNSYVNKFATGDLEKSWMFYAFITQHFRYDYQRNPTSAKYSPYLTTYKQSGVCRDFAQLYAFFLTKNSISNYVVVGKVPTSFRSKISKRIHHYSTFTNHAWNVAFIDQKWVQFDVTWANLHHHTKLTSAKSNDSAITVDTTYFMPDPQFFSLTHKPVNPIFYLLAHVPTYRSSFGSHRQYNKTIDYLQLLTANEQVTFKEFSPIFDSVCRSYSKHDFLEHNYKITLSHLNAQRTPFNPFTSETFRQDSLFVSQLTQYIDDHYHVNFTSHLKYFLLHYFEAKQISN
jgi:hypothetical protein